MAGTVAVSHAPSASSECPVGKRYVAVAVFEGVVVVPVHPRARGKTQPCLLPTPSHGSYVGGLELGV